MRCRPETDHLKSATTCQTAVTYRVVAATGRCSGRMWKVATSNSPNSMLVTHTQFVDIAGPRRCALPSSNHFPRVVWPPQPAPRGNPTVAQKLFDTPYLAIHHGRRLKYLAFPSMPTTQCTTVRSARNLRISGLRLNNDGVSHKYSTYRSCSG